MFDYGVMTFSHEILSGLQLIFVLDVTGINCGNAVLNLGEDSSIVVKIQHGFFVINF